jgi:hypothetical protein
MNVSAATASRATRAEDVALARRLLQRPAGLVAFIPAGDDLEVWHVLPRLAAAMRVLSPGDFALVRVPAFHEDARPPGPTLLRTRALGPGLDELLMPRTDGPVRAVAPLAGMIEQARLRYAHILLDASGFLPDAPEVLDLPDAVVSVAAAGLTRERDLLDLVAMLPSDRHVGTLLVE